MTRPDLKALWPNFQSMGTRDLCALYDAALTLDDVATTIGNSPRYIDEDFGACVRFSSAGEAVVAWGNFYSDMRDAIATELQKRPITDQTFMTLVGHVNRYGDDPVEVVNLAADLLARRDAVPQAAE